MTLFACSSKEQGEIEQVVKVYNSNDSIINSYSTSLRVNDNLEYIYHNSNSTLEDVNVNDLFQILSDSMAAFDYDTCRLIETKTITTKSKTYELKKYKLLDFDTYILFNNEVGIIQIKNDSKRTDFGATINEY